MSEKRMIFSRTVSIHILGLMVGLLILSACETQDKTPDSQISGQPASTNVIETSGADAVSIFTQTIEPISTEELVTPVPVYTEIFPVACEENIEARLSIISTEEGLVNSQMQVVISQADLQSLPFENQEARDDAKADYIARVNAATLQIAGASSAVEKVYIPQFVDLDETRMRVEGNLGTPLPFELAHQQVDDVVGENELSVNVLVGQRSAVMIFGEGSRVIQRGEASVMQGKVMQLVYNVDAEKVELMPLPEAGLGGVQEVVAHDGCPIDTVVVSMGRVLAIFNEDTQSWVRTTEVVASDENLSLNFSERFALGFSEEYVAETGGVEIPIGIALEHWVTERPEQQVKEVHIAPDIVDILGEVFLRSCHYRYTELMGNDVTYEEYLELVSKHDISTQNRKIKSPLKEN